MSSTNDAPNGSLHAAAEFPFLTDVAVMILNPVSSSVPAVVSTPYVIFCEVNQTFHAIARVNEQGRTYLEVISFA